ncbi:MAG: DUF192 domain-containing protein [Verrucomicrobiae bacterium]|nr:DUF192 domain-containing protein [Verrucomicrobiae bacterium]
MSRWLFVSIFIFWTITGCSSHQEELQILKIDQKELKIELADSPQEWAKGLMYRKTLPKNQGMLFAFPQARRASFWMQNTYVPLSIAFINREGEILEIHDMQPLDATPIQSLSSDIWFALEVNQGWFERNGVEVGDKIEVKHKK